MPRKLTALERARFDLRAVEALAAGLAVDGEDWRLLGLCAQTDPEAFFPDQGGSVREAKAVCARCEVRAQCLAYALEHDERFGVWGGLSERERRALRRMARAAGAGQSGARTQAAVVAAALDGALPESA